MTLIDDLAHETNERELDRRKLLGLVGSGALAAAAGGTVLASLQYIAPNVLYEEGSRIGVGRAESFWPGMVLFLPKHRVYVVRSEKGFYALSAVCTHLGCMTRHEPAEKRIFCPCHGSQFSLEGKVTAGPAPRPLPRLEVSIERGVVVVDRRRLAPPDWVLEV